jgi:hypothetical protein
MQPTIVVVKEVGCPKNYGALEKKKKISFLVKCAHLYF